MLLARFTNVDNMLETRYGGLGMHILAFTPKMEHTFNIVRDSKPDEAFGISADFNENLECRPFTLISQPAV